MGQKEYLKSALVDDMDSCIVCGCPREQIHHIFGGSNRNKSTRYGYFIPLCMEHHTGNDGVHNNRAMDVYLKQRAQEHFEEHHGSREDFIKEFGKSWK